MDISLKILFSVPFCVAMNIIAESISVLVYFVLTIQASLPSEVMAIFYKVQNSYFWTKDSKIFLFNFFLP